MPAPVVVKFATAGARDVAAVFDSLTKKIQDFSRKQGAAARSAQQSARQMAQAQAKVAVQSEQVAERSAAAIVRSAEKAARAELKAVEQNAKRIDRIRENSAKMAGRYAEQAARAEAAAARKSADANAKKWNGRIGAIGGAARNAFGQVSGALGMMTGGLGVAAVASDLNASMQLNRRAVLLSNMTQMPGATSRSGQSLLADARGVATATGAPAEDVMGMMEIVGQRAGGAVGIEKLNGDLRALTELAIGAGVSLEDMGGVVAAAFNAGVKPGDDLQGLVRSLIAQGKAGAIEFSDFASELGRLGGVGSKWGSGTRMLQTVGGLTQIASQTAIGAEESRTTVVDLMREFSQGPKLAMLSSMGVRTHEANGLMRDPAELISETIDAVESGKANKLKLPGLGASERAKMDPAQIRAATYAAIFTGRSGEIMQTLANTYRNGDQASQGGAAGVRERIEKASRPYVMTREQAAAETAAVEQTMALARAHEQFKAKMDELLPQVVKLIPHITTLTEKLAGFVTWFAKNPLSGLGTLVAASFARELAAAQVGEVAKAGVKTIVESLLSGANKGGVGGNLAALGTIAMTATAVYLIGTKIIDKVFDDANNVGSNAIGASVELTNATSKARAARESGAVTPELIAEMEAKSKSAHEAIAAVDQGPSWSKYASYASQSLSAGILPASQVESLINSVVVGIQRSGAGGKPEDLKRDAESFDAMLGELRTIAANTANGGAPSPNNPARNAPAFNGALR